jgi:hypothetical protein
MTGRWVKHGRLSIMVVHPPILDEYPDELKDAMAVRAAGIENGRCVCGGGIAWDALDIIEDGKTLVPMVHADFCVARDENVSRFMTEWLSR